MSEYRNYDEDFIYDSSNYDKHVSAMTGEQLHSKSDIAAELAYRDDLIDQLQQRLEEAEAEVGNLSGELGNMNHLCETISNERDHWKSNHDNQVSAARLLKERLDMPVERVRAYNHTLSLQKQCDEMAAYIERVKTHAESIIFGADRDFRDCEKEGLNIIYEIPLNHIQGFAETINRTPQASLAEHDREVRARAVEEAVELYTHELDGTDEMNQVSIDIIKKGRGFIYPEGLLEHANKIREENK